MIQIAAAELWIIPVTIVPARTPRSGFSNAVRILTKLADSRRGAMDELIIVIPCIRIPNPTSIIPMSLRLCFLEAIIIIVPTRAKISENTFG